MPAGGLGPHARMARTLHGGVLRHQRLRTAGPFPPVAGGIVEAAKDTTGLFPFLFPTGLSEYMDVSDPGF